METEKVNQLLPKAANDFNTEFGAQITSIQMSRGLIDRIALKVWQTMRERDPEWPYSIAEAKQHARIALGNGSIVPTREIAYQDDEGWSSSEFASIFMSDQQRMAFLAFIIGHHGNQGARVEAANKFKLPLAQVKFVFRLCVIRQAFPSITLEEQVRKTKFGYTTSDIYRRTETQSVIANCFRELNWDINTVDNVDQWDNVPSYDEVNRLRILDASLVAPIGESEELSPYGRGIPNRTHSGSPLGSGRVTRSSGNPVKIINKRKRHSQPIPGRPVGRKHFIFDGHIKAGIY